MTNHLVWICPDCKQHYTPEDQAAPEGQGWYRCNHEPQCGYAKSLQPSILQPPTGTQPAPATNQLPPPINQPAPEGTPS